jgi:hypothetical protein
MRHANPLVPIRVSRFSASEREIVLSPSLAVSPRFDAENDAYLVADVPEFGLSLCDQSRDELVADLDDQLRFIWCEYAEAKTAGLSEDALALRDALLARGRFAASE